MCSVKKLLDIFIRISPMSSVYSTKNVVTNCKKFGKKLEKKVEIFFNFFIILGKTALNQGKGFFSAVCIPHREPH